MTTPNLNTASPNSAQELAALPRQAQQLCNWISLLRADKSGRLDGPSIISDCSRMLMPANPSAVVALTDEARAELTKVVQKLGWHIAHPTEYNGVYSCSVGFGIICGALKNSDAPSASLFDTYCPQAKRFIEQATANGNELQGRAAVARFVMGNILIRAILEPGTLGNIKGADKDKLGYLAIEMIRSLESWTAVQPSDSNQKSVVHSYDQIPASHRQATESRMTINWTLEKPSDRQPNDHAYAVAPNRSIPMKNEESLKGLEHVTGKIVDIMRAFGVEVTAISLSRYPQFAFGLPKQACFGLRYKRMA